MNNTIADTIPSTTPSINNDTNIMSSYKHIVITTHFQSQIIPQLFQSLRSHVSQILHSEIHTLPFPDDLTMDINLMTKKERQLVELIWKFYMKNLDICELYVRRNVFGLVAVGEWEGGRFLEGICRDYWKKYNGEDTSGSVLDDKRYMYQKDVVSFENDTFPKNKQNIPSAEVIHTIQREIQSLRQLVSSANVKYNTMTYQLAYIRRVALQVIEVEDILRVSMSSNGTKDNGRNGDEKKGETSVVRLWMDVQDSVSVAFIGMKGLTGLTSTSQTLSKRLDAIQTLRTQHEDSVNNNSTQEDTKTLNNACKYALRELEDEDGTNEEWRECKRRKKVLTLDEEYDLRKDVIRWTEDESNESVVKGILSGLRKNGDVSCVG